MLEPCDGLGYLRGRISLVVERVGAAVARRRASDASPHDQFRGLYVSEADVDRLLDVSSWELLGPLGPEATAEAAALEARADEAERRGAVIALRRLARAFGLDRTDVEMLLIALAPDLDARLERLYGYLHDDVTRRRASIGLALELCGATGGGRARRRLGPAGPLVSGGLLVIEDAERPFLTRALRVPDRVTAHLLEDDTPDPLVAELLVDPVEAHFEDVAVLVRALAGGIRLVYVHDRTGTSGTSYAAAALRHCGRPAVIVDLSRLSTEADLASLAGVAIREARLRAGCLVVGPIDALLDRGLAALSALAQSPCPAVLVGSCNWDPRWSREVPLVIVPPALRRVQGERIWRDVLDEGRLSGPDVVGTTAQFRLSPEQIVRAATAARRQALAVDHPVSALDVQAGARAQNAAGLERLARRVEPRMSWGDLVLPDAVVEQLRDLTARVRHRDRVLDDWGMSRSAAKGRGITALFVGESGTGKTISAEVVAGELGLSLYVIDLATVVDKYVGETEKNLDRIFNEADRVNGVLLFDEADAIFGKRSEVKDAHDRYANVEVAYLLQRMELFDGLAILTTNLRGNVDEAFTRRLDLVVEIPMPEDDHRRRLWEHHLARGVPRSGDIDFDFLARAFELSGGNIRNITLAAAFLAADGDRAVTMADLIRATAAEYRKLGHLCLEMEFGPYFPLVASNGQS